MPEQPLNSMQTLQTTETKTRQRLEMKERPALSGSEIPDVAGCIIDIASSTLHRFSSVLPALCFWSLTTGTRRETAKTSPHAGRSKHSVSPLTGGDSRDLNSR